MKSVLSTKSYEDFARWLAPSGMAIKYAVRTATVFFLVCPALVYAGTNNARWTGNGASDAWTDNNNWVDTNPPNAEQGTVTYYGSLADGKRTYTNMSGYGSYFYTGTFIFDSTTTQYQLGATNPGSTQVRMFGGVQNGATYQAAGTVTPTQTLSTFTIGLGADVTFTPRYGDLNVYSTIYGDGHTLFITGNNGKNLYLNGTFSNGSSTSNLQLSENSTVYLNSANNFAGTTTVNAGKLVASNAQALGSTSGITVNSGGTLLLGNNAGTYTGTNHINDSAGVTLKGGGKFGSGGLSEGTRPSAPTGGTAGAAGIGTLTLQSTSASSHATIDFSTGANGSSLVFSSLAGGSGAYVDILNWSGTARTDAGTASNDRLLFASNPGLSQTDLAHFAFFDDSNNAFAVGGMVISYGNEFEIVPVPEPATWLAGFLTLGAAVYGLRRRLRAFAAA